MLSELLRPHEELVHSINGRVKDFNSLEAKVYRPSARYKKLDDITDVAGIRIIVYFASDVDRIAEVVRSEFEIATEYDLTLSDVYAALAYYYDHREEIDQSIREGEAFAEAMRAKTPSKVKEKLHGRSA